MAEADPADEIDWSLTTWEGARREQLRRWAELPLEQIILALEEMAELAEAFGSQRSVWAAQPMGDARSVSATGTGASAGPDSHIRKPKP